MNILLLKYQEPENQEKKAMDSIKKIATEITWSYRKWTHSPLLIKNTVQRVASLNFTLIIFTLG